MTRNLEQSESLFDRFRRGKENHRVLPPVPAYTLLDKPLPAELQDTKLAQAPVFLFRESLGKEVEHTAVFGLPLTHELFWELLQTCAPYPREWPSAVLDDWNMADSRAPTHAPALKDAWDDFIPHIEVFKRLMPRLLRSEIPKLSTEPEYKDVNPDKYIIPITRWNSDGVDLEKKIITEHVSSPRSSVIEEFLQKLTRNFNINYQPDNVNELAGFMMNTYLAHDTRSNWKPFMDLEGNEYDERKFGKNNFIGPAQIATRSLMVRDKIARNSFFPNSERRLLKAA